MLCRHTLFHQQEHQKQFQVGKEKDAVEKGMRATTKLQGWFAFDVREREEAQKRHASSDELRTAPTEDNPAGAVSSGYDPDAGAYVWPCKADRYID